MIAQRARRAARPESLAGLLLDLALVAFWMAFVPVLFVVLSVPEIPGP
ncbi:hypothetical protein ACFV24_20520 [Nocardia fluminea]|nr:hypothetical protein [Nocardia salmonicida]